MNMNQSELLAAPVLHAKRLQQAKVAADNAIGRAADRVDRESPEWIAAALEGLRHFAQTQSASAFTIELARGAIAPSLPPCGDLRVWGHVVREAVKRGYIERLPGWFYPAASSHGSLKACWTRGAKA